MASEALTAKAAEVALVSVLVTVIVQSPVVASAAKVAGIVNWVALSRV